MITVVPENDLKPHDRTSTTCHCQPRVTFENGEMIIIHNSFDKREFEEEGGMERCEFPPIGVGNDGKPFISASDLNNKGDWMEAYERWHIKE